MTAQFNFTGKTVLVSGASRGIGYGVAQAFAMAGADLTVLSGGEGIDAAAEALSKECGRPVRGIQCDIADAGAECDRRDWQIECGQLNHERPLDTGGTLNAVEIASRPSQLVPGFDV